MRKRSGKNVEVLDFDYQEYFNEMFETTTVLMWSTRHTSYTFAYYLNKLYGLELERKDNITIGMPGGRDEELECAVYHCLSAVEHIAYLLIDSSKGVKEISGKKKGTLFDKTLLIIGDGSDELAQRIYEDMSLGPQMCKDYREEEREMRRREFIDTGILESVLFDFSNPEELETTYFQNTLKDEKLENRRQAFLKEQRNFVTELMMALDKLLPNFEEEEGQEGIILRKKS